MAKWREILRRFVDSPIPRGARKREHKLVIDRGRSSIPDINAGQLRVGTRHETDKHQTVRETAKRQSRTIEIHRRRQSSAESFYYGDAHDLQTLHASRNNQPLCSRFCSAILHDNLRNPAAATLGIPGGIFREADRRSSVNSTRARVRAHWKAA